MVLVDKRAKVWQFKQLQVVIDSVRKILNEPEVISGLWWSNPTLRLSTP